jgi:hypothetical protein
MNARGSDNLPLGAGWSLTGRFSTRPSSRRSGDNDTDRYVLAQSGRVAGAPPKARGSSPSSKTACLSAFSQKTPLSRIIRPYARGRTGPQSPISCRERRASPSVDCYVTGRGIHPALRELSGSAGSTASSRSCGRAECGSRSERSRHLPCRVAARCQPEPVEEMAVVRTGAERVFDSEIRAGSRCLLRPRYATV